jgi:4-diphosphocytidyl-2-C-methyl-D-erythritol kinase
MKGLACAKINLGLKVGRLREDGLHHIVGLFQSIALCDRLVMALDVDEDIMESLPLHRSVPEGDANLAWRAAAAVRDLSGSRRAMRLALDKQVPVAAGLGGGSADAAAALAMAARLLDADREEVAALAPGLGSDVAFCLRGGTAVVTGGGEDVAPIDDVAGFALAIVVPPIELSTAAVYRRWDEIDGPEAVPVSPSSLPPALRDLAPLANDLYPAAVSVEAAVDEWRSELASRFDRPVLMSGSGPALFAFFVDRDEAQDAADSVPPGARAVWAGDPATYGWALRRDDGEAVVDSRGRTWSEDEETRWWRGTFEW